MKNIFVVGTSGSGKSTLGTYLAESLNYRYLELDSIYWMPNWTAREASELAQILETEQSKPGGLVLDGNVLSKGAKIAPADVLIFLDYSRALVVSRVLRRTIRRVITRQELWSGNREQAKFLVSTNPELNPVLWAYKTHFRRRNEYLTLISSLGETGIMVHHIKTKRQLRALKKNF
jgi:adenylate kinase family enzyme